MAEAVGRTLATRLLELTDDPGMKDMLNYLIARDTMHQQQWLAVLEELGPEQAMNAAPPEAHAGLESTAPDGASASAAARFTRGLGSVMDKMTPGA